MTRRPRMPKLAGTAAAIRSAAERACPKCERRSALVKGRAWVKGKPVRVCRWCGYVEEAKS